MLLLAPLLQVLALAPSRYIVLRHGETNHNALGIIQGSSDVSRLTETGRLQAKAAGRALAALEDVTIGRVFVSPLSRARETLECCAAAASNALPPSKEWIVLDSLREIDLHSWEGRSKAELRASFASTYAAWQSDPVASTSMTASPSSTCGAVPRVRRGQQ